jgi:DHA1 family multidrug resistance protein-like MFS transporter
MELSDSTERATFYAFEGILSTILGAIVGIFSGYLADLFGPRNIFILSAAMAITATIYTRIILRGK